MKLIVNKEYEFKFAGSIVKGTFHVTQKLYDGSTIYMFKDKKGYKYPVRKENIKL